MHWNRRSVRGAGAATALALLLAVSLAAGWFQIHSAFAQSQGAPRLSIYSPQSTYSLPVQNQAGHEYVGLFEALEPLGTVELKPAGKNWQVQFGTKTKNSQGEFALGRQDAKVDGNTLQLPAPLVSEGSHILVSVDTLPVLLNAFVDTKSVLHAGRRLFVNIPGLQPSVELKPGDAQAGNGSALVLSFQSPVNPEVSTGGNQVHLLFSREPVLAGNTGTFDDPVIKGIQFQESNGTVEATISGTAPLLATFGDGGKQIAIAAAPKPQAPASQTEPPANASAPRPAAPQPAPANTSPAKMVIVLDPGHGGMDPGARIDTNLNEKDVVLAAARKLRTELQNHGFNPILLRDGDTTLDNDQRAMAANAATPALYVSLHANTSGSGIHVYTSLLRPVSPAPVFPEWDTAQAGYLDKSEHISMLIGEALNQANLPAIQGKAALRPLDNIAAAALAIEFSPFDNGGEKEDITQANYQQTMAAAIAGALAANRTELEPGQ